MRGRLHGSATTSLKDDPQYQSVLKSCELNSLRSISSYSNSSVRTVSSVENNSLRNDPCRNTSLQRRCISKPYDDEEKLETIKSSSNLTSSSPPRRRYSTTMSSGIEILRNTFSQAEKAKTLHGNRRRSSLGDFL